MNTSLVVPLPIAESEIFKVLAENFRLSAENCEKLAWDPQRGRIYYTFMDQIKMIERCAYQAGTFREDARWFTISLQMGQVLRRCGAWMRGSRTKDERKEADKRFKKLADILRKLQYECEHRRDAATGRAGMILPEPLEGPNRETRPVQILLP